MASAERHPLNEAQAAHLIKMTLEHERGATSRTFAAGDEVGPYTLKQQLGKGAFGMVWQASQKEPVKRDVALKILRPGLDIEESSDRFRIEGFALARMSHPGIAAVLDVGTLPTGEPYFAMELVKGGSITRYCKDKNLSLRDRLLLMAQVCHAVQHAHQRAVLHRDLKPSNILVAEVDGRPQPKVIDFGIAKPMTDDVTGDLTVAQTLRGVVLGTPRYMAPEQAALSGGGADARADVYALGTILYELITGETPVKEDDFSTTALPALLKKICEEEPRRPSLLLLGKDKDSRPKTDGFTVRDLQELDWVVLKALEKQPDRRYAAAVALADDLTAFCDHQPLSVGPPDFGYRVHKLFQRHRALVAAALIGIICMAVAAFVSINAYLEETKAHYLAEKAAAESAVSARRATAAMEFLSGVLQESGRQIGAGANATALRGALQHAEEQLKAIASQPDLVAALSGEMASTYQAMGDVDHAIPLRKQAVALLTKLHGPDAPPVLEAKTELAWALGNGGRQVEALPLYEDLARTWAAKGRGYEGKLFETRRRLANALSVTGRRPEGLQVMRSLLDTPDEKGKPGRESLSFMRTLAEMQASNGDLVGGRETLEECLARSQQKKSKAGDKTRSSLLLTLARIEVKEKSYTQAAKHFQESLDAGRSAGVVDYQSEIDMLIEMARAFRSGGMLDGALRRLNEAEGIARTADNRRQLAHCYSARGQICKAAGSNELAVEAYRSFLAVSDASSPGSRRMWRDANRDLVDCLVGLNRHEEARQVAVKFWESMKDDPNVSEDPLEWAEELAKMIQVVQAWKKVTQSAEMDDMLAQWQARMAMLNGSQPKLAPP